MFDYHLETMAESFAREKHAGQLRKYTGEPYANHLNEVAELTSSFGGDSIAVAASWLHDTMEDQGVSHEELSAEFGLLVADTVLSLSDLEQGGRAHRKALARERLSRASGRAQMVKVADIISNTKDIVDHDPNFARLYLTEQELLLSVLLSAPAHARDLAYKTLSGAKLKL